MILTTIETYRVAWNPNLLIVALYADDGTVGLGETFFGAAVVETYIHEIAARPLFGSDSLAPNEVTETLRSYVGYQGSGAETRGNSAIDIALWDLLATKADQPLYAILGGPVRKGVRVYNTCAGSDYVSTNTQQHSSNWGLDDASGELEDLAAFFRHPGRLARELLEEGITAMKIWPFDRAAEASGGMSIDSVQVAEGCRILAEIRDEVGNEMDVMIELHGLWNLPSAVKIMQALSQYQPTWVEDPLRPDSLDALISLRRQTDIPVAGGETLTGRQGYLPLLAAGVIDTCIIDLTWTGGLGEAVKVASLAQSFGVPVAPHDCTGPIALAAGTHLSVSQPNVSYQETVRAFHRGWYRSLVEGLPQISSGTIWPSEEPGLGLRLAAGLAERTDVSVRITGRSDLS